MTHVILCINDTIPAHSLQNAYIQSIFIYDIDIDVLYIVLLVYIYALGPA